MADTDDHSGQEPDSSAGVRFTPHEQRLLAALANPQLADLLLSTDFAESMAQMARGESVVLWPPEEVERARRERIRQAGMEAIREYEAEYGAFTEAELAEADEVLRSAQDATIRGANAKALDRLRQHGAMNEQDEQDTLPGFAPIDDVIDALESIPGIDANRAEREAARAAEEARHRQVEESAPRPEGSDSSRTD